MADNPMRASLLAFFVLLSGVAAPRSAAATADNTAPTVTNFQMTDCEGNYQPNATISSTGTPSFRLNVRDMTTSGSSTPTVMGLRVGRTPHIGGPNASPHLLLHAHLDDGGATAASSTTFAFNGAVAGAAACAAGQGHSGGTDGCYSFAGDNSGNEIVFAAGGALNSTSPAKTQLTMQAWIFPTTLNNEPILEWNTVTQNGVHLWHGLKSDASAGNNGELFANIVDTFGVDHVIASTAGFVKANEWQLVTMTFNGTLAKLYHNHVVIATTAFNGIPAPQTSFPFTIGRRRTSVKAFLGRIDEVRVFSTAISDDEIEADAFSGIFSFKTTGTASVPPQRQAMTGAGFTDGSVVLSTIDIVSVPLKAGSANTVFFSFQDKVGNTRKTSAGITVIETVPDTPEALVVSAAGTSQIGWTWARGLRLCRLTGAAGHFRVYNAATNAVIVTSQPVASYNRFGVAANTPFGIKVSAIDDFGESPLVGPTSAYTFATVPTAPSITSISTGSAIFSWTSANPAYTRFEVSLSLDGFSTVLSTPVQIANNLTATTLGLLGLQAQTTYDVRVRAFNGQAGDAATEGSVFTTFLSTQFATLVLAPGTLIGAPLGSAGVTWTWSAVPTATSYTLESSTGTTLAVTAALTHTVTNLSPNASYGARLRVNNPSGSGEFGPIVNVFTNPNAPAGTAVPVIGTATAKVTWALNGNPGNTSFQVQISTRSDFSSLQAAVSVAGTEAVVGGLQTGTGYFARVKASGFGASSAFDATISFVTLVFAAVSSTGAPPTPYAFASNSVAVYHFDEAGTTRTLDASAFANHGSLSGIIGSTPTIVIGQSGLGNAARFPGLTGSVMTAPHAAALAGTGNLTVQAWVNPASAVQVQDAGIVVKGTGTDETFILDISAASLWRFGVRAGDGTLFSISSTQSLRADAWTHVAGVYNSAAPSLSVYVDGNLSATTAVAPAARRVTVGTLSVGNRRSLNAASFDRAFRGDIDEVHIQTAALSAVQVGVDYASARPGTLTPPSPNDGLQLIIPPNTFGGAAVILFSSSPLTVPISITPQILADGVSSPPAGQTLVPNSIFEIVANVGGLPFVGTLGSTVTIAIPYPDNDGNGLVDGTFPPIPAQNLKVYTLNTAVTSWEALPSSLDAANRRVLGQTSHFSIFALFGPTGIKPNTDQVRLYPRPWRPGSNSNFDSVTFAGSTGLAIDNLPTSGSVLIFTLSGELVRDLSFGAVNAGTLIWNGTNHAGRRVASGVYFAIVKGDDSSSTVIKFAIER